GAQFNVGLLYFAGVAVSQNRVEAAKWFRRAADQGHNLAQEYLGLSYATGLGVPQDNIHAYMWLSLAAAQGDQDAISNRDRVEPPRVCRRPFGLSHAAMAGFSSMA